MKALLILLLVFFACMFSTKKPYESNNDLIVGNWYSCNPDGLYYETYFQEDSAVMILGALFGRLKRHYRVEGDSLIIFIYDTESRYYVEFAHPDTFYRELDGERFKYIRIKEDLNYDINFGMEDWDDYMGTVLQRSFLNCP
jgi:hypothetical protein